MTEEAPMFDPTSHPETVTILLGPSSQKYIVPKNVITRESQYFLFCFLHNMPEAKAGVFTLGGVQPWIFDVFVKWANFGVLPEAEPDWRAVAGKPENDVNLERVEEAMFEAYVFGQDIAAGGFRAAVLKQYEEWMSDGLPDYTNIAFAYKRLLKDDPLLAVVERNYVKHSGWYYDDPEPRPGFDQVPAEFFARVESLRQVQEELDLDKV